MAELRIGLVGAGGIGKAHLNAWKSVADAKVVAIADVDAARAEAAAAEIGARACAGHEEMLAAGGLDAVDVCTPPVFHAEPVKAALAAGLNVLCEKPLAEGPVAAREMVAAARESGRLLMTAFCHRFHPPVVALRRLIDEGKMGEIRMMRNRFAGPFAGIEDVWFSNPGISGGGCLMDTSVHSVDLFRFLAGEVTRVEGAGVRINPKLAEGVEDTAAMLLQSEGGAIGIIEASWALPAGTNSVEVYGTKGVAFVRYWEVLPSEYRLDGMDGFEPLPEEGDRFVGELTHFAAACRGECELAVTGFDGLRAVEVIYDAYRSAGLR
jgi:UDP-N-acetylglucosamine 3-dehydrogenase